MKANILIAAIAAALSIGALSSSPASAEDAGAPVRFRYYASELASDASTAATYERMNLRARKKCDPRGEFTTDARDACAADLVGQWVVEIDDPRLTKIHRGRDDT